MESVLGSIISFFIVLFSYKAFRDYAFSEHYIFDVDKILVKKEYYRLFSSAFLHGSWFHLGFNLIALLSFSGEVESFYGWWQYLVLFFGSVLFANLLALYFHRNHGDYRALGASGGVSGVLMAFVIASPNSEISFIFVPIGIKSWIFGIAYVIISIIAIKRSNDNIGHEAHLGGAITGVLLAILFNPGLLLERSWLIAAILIPSAAFLWFSIKNPAFFLLDNYWPTASSKRGTRLKVSHKKKLSKEDELNFLLGKIKQKGLDGLSKKERKRLEELSAE